MDGKKRLGAVSVLVLSFVLAGFAQVADYATIAKRPFYQLNVTLAPETASVSGTILIKYVNPLDHDINNVLFAFPVDLIPSIRKVRVNRRSAEILPDRFTKAQNGWEGFELQSKRSLPTGAVSEIEIEFSVRSGLPVGKIGDFIVFRGDWFPRILGPQELIESGEIDPALHIASDYDGTVRYPLEWRGALSGRILMQDAQNDLAEMMNAATNVANYGVALAQEYLVAEQDVYTIKLRGFYREDEERWMKRIMADVRHVLEYYKRSTPIVPPMIMNVVPVVEHGETQALFANTIGVNRKLVPGHEETRIAIARAIGSLYWGFEGAATAPANAVESGIVQYGVWRYCAARNMNQGWAETEKAAYYSCWLDDHLSILNNDVFSEINHPLVQHALAGSVFLNFVHLEEVAGEEVIEKAYFDLFETQRYHDLNNKTLATKLERSLDRKDIHAWDLNASPVDAFVKSVEYKGVLAERHVTVLELCCSSDQVTALTVSYTLTNGETGEQMVEATDSLRTTLRTPFAVADVQVKPSGLFPSKDEAYRSTEAILMLLREMKAAKQFALMDRLITTMTNGTASEEIKLLQAVAKLNIGQVDAAKKIVDAFPESNIEATEIRNQIAKIFGTPAR